MRCTRAATEKPRGKTETAAKRELVNTGKDKRYVRRSTTGQFRESDDVGRSSNGIVSKRQSGR
jgi:hypothetical protein